MARPIGGTLAGGTTLDAATIHQLVVTAGFPANDVETMVGIALAESKGDTKAHNSKPPDDSYGLFQINMIGKLGPERRKQFGITSNDALYNPSTNARAAKIVYDAQGLKAWSTYTSGSYKTAKDKSGKTAADISADPIGDKISSVGGSITNPITSIAAVLAKVGLDIVTVIIIVTFIVLGVILLARKPIGRIAGGVAKSTPGPTGKIAKEIIPDAPAAPVEVPAAPAKTVQERYVAFREANNL